MTKRAHIILSAEVLDTVDRVAGRRKRSRFVEEAIREKLSRVELDTALRKTAGVIDLAEYPDWRTPTQTTAWVRASRRRDLVRLSRKQGPRRT